MNLIDERLLLISPSHHQIVGRISGNLDSEKVVVLCHGFGVKSDSRGMYNHICNELGTDFLFVRFHFVKVDTLNNTSFTPTITSQVETLKTVVNSLISKHPDKKISLVGHSQGCYVVSKLLNENHYNVEEVVLLGPPTRENVGKVIVEKWKKKEGSEVDLTGISSLKRTDGSTTLVPKEFWEDASDLNSKKLFKFVDENFNAHFVWAKGDSIEKPQEYSNLLELKVKNLYELEGDHDFKTDGWVGLVKLLKNLL